MYLDPRSTIAGQPALKMRAFFRYVGFYGWSVSLLAKRLEITKHGATTVVRELERIGYIERVEKSYLGRTEYQRTIAGSALALASAARPVSRATAESRLRDFLARIETVNADPYYLYRVDRAVVFGSFLTDAPKLNDVDVAVVLQSKAGNSEQRMAWRRERTYEARLNGRTFSNVSEEMFWPEKEVLLFLKSRSRTIGLHTDDPILEQTETREIYPKLDTSHPALARLQAGVSPTNSRRGVRRS